MPKNKERAHNSNARNSISKMNLWNRLKKEDQRAASELLLNDM
jgi:hypothetical protein